MALSGRLFIKINNNQMEDGFDVRGYDWYETRGGGTRGNDGRPSFGAVNRAKKKIERWADPWP